MEPSESVVLGKLLPDHLLFTGFTSPIFRLDLVGRGGGLEDGGGGGGDVDLWFCEMLVGGEKERRGAGSTFCVFEMTTPLLFVRVKAVVLVV